MDGCSRVVSLLYTGGAVSNGIDKEESCCHGQEDSGHDVGRDEGACALSVGDNQESSCAERQTGRSSVPSQGGRLRSLVAGLSMNNVRRHCRS